ncbi:hypothetical protein ACFXEL_35085 [Streptomyces sp. NPDC059382]|uniref:hypothetical protein n=1 Tax=Streptomyces sp. NPDC059382 TaxID=3346816 RepID=UPI0036C7BBBD
MTTPTLTIRGPLSLAGVPIRCPGRESAPTPRRLTLLVNGKEVMASCGEKHRGKNGGPKAGCFFGVQEITPAMIKLLLDKTEPNRRFRITTSGGKVIEGKRGPAVKAPPAAGGAASSRYAAKKAEARGGKQPAVRAVRSGGGGLTAALNTVAAVAGTATAAVNAVGAAANAVGATANAAGKGFDMGREGMRAGTAAIKAADNAGARNFARENSRSDSGEDAG